MWAFSTVYPQEFLIVTHPPLPFEYSIGIAEDKMRREDACLWLQNQDPPPPPVDSRSRES